MLLPLVLSNPKGVALVGVAVLEIFIFVCDVKSNSMYDFNGDIYNYIYNNDYIYI